MNKQHNPTESTHHNSDWAELTQECLNIILSRLTIEDRFNGAMMVCKPWMKACIDPSLSKVLNLENYFDSSTESTQWWSPEFEKKIDCILKSAVDWSDGSLIEIRVRHCSHRSLVFAAQRCPKLQVLSIKSSQNVTDASMSEVAKGCPMLKELDISFCHQISHESLTLIGRNCPNLKILKRNFMYWLDSSQHKGIVPHEYLDAIPQDGDSEVAAIAKYMPGLEILEIQFLKLTGKGLTLITEGCLNLLYLDVYGCANLTSREINKACPEFKNLRRLSV